MSNAHDDGYAGIFTPTAAASGDGPNSSGGTSYNVIVSPGFETQTLLESLYASPVDGIGSDKFIAAYCVNLERLSIQAHWTAGVIASEQIDAVAVTTTAAATPGLSDVLSSLAGAGGGGGEEYIVEAFLENFDKLDALVKTLLALEFWRENVLFVGRHNKLNGYLEEEDEEVEFEIEGGERAEDEAAVQFNNLNEVDGGEEDNATGKTEPKGLAHRLAANRNALRAAFVLHAETTIVSLLNLIFYKGVPAVFLEGSAGDDVLLSLVDYCARQLIFLGSPEESNPALSRQKNPLPASKLSSYLQSRTCINEIKDSIYDSTYQTAIASVALSRYLCENLDEVGPSLLSRVLEVHDFPLLMVPLIEEPPWTRRRMVEKKGSNNSNSTKMIWEKLDDHNEWKEVPPSDLLRVTKLEGQPWLALFHLTTAKVCRESYGLDEYRKSQLMRLRRYIQQVIMDQLPVLGDVARYLDELSILGVPPAGQGVHRPSSNASSSGLLLQRVDSLRESIIGKQNMQDCDNWEIIAQRQWEAIFSRVTDSKDEALRRIASEVYGGAGLDNDDVANDYMKVTPSSGQENLLNEEPPQSTADDWKVSLSKPIEKVVLDLKDNNNNSLATFELVPKHTDAVAMTDTPLGQFRRMKMSISQTFGEGEAIFPLAKVTARIQFQNDPSSDSSNEAVLSVDSLDLPATEHNMSPHSYDEVGIALPENFPSKEWRQLGDLEGRSVVLQLGFKRLSRGMVPAGATVLRGYSLSQSFLSQPAMLD